MKYLFIFLATLVTTSCLSQKETNNWYFSQGGAIDFSYGKPFAHTNSRMIGVGGSSSISDHRGRLLFYTNGHSIWDSTHQIMAGGNTDLSFWNTSQYDNSIIVPLPGSNHLFYVFMIQNFADTVFNGITYSIVNMKLNSGRGDVEMGKKNLILYNKKLSTKLTATRHLNGIDFWIVSNFLISDTIIAWQLGPSGIKNIPVISKTNLLSPSTYSGTLKISSDGSKLINVNHPDSILIADFNNATGQVIRKWAILGGRAKNWDIEFSPTNKYLYLTCVPEIHQYDLTAKSASAFLSSKKVINLKLMGQICLQIGLDNKIYISDETKQLHVIHAPDSLGNSCRPEKNYVYLEGNQSTSSMTNFISSLFQKRTFIIKPHCLNKTVSFFITNLDNLDSVKWNFGEPSSSTNNYSNNIVNVLHTFKDTGNYTITLLYFSRGNWDSSKVSFNIQDTNGLNLDFDLNDVCEGQNAKFFNKSSMNDNLLSYNWKFGDGKTTNQHSPEHKYDSDGITRTFNVTLVATSQSGCADSITKPITVNTNPKSDFTFTLKGSQLELKANQSGNLNYRWKFGNEDSISLSSTSYTHNLTKPEHYHVCLNTINLAGCKSETCKNITLGIHNEVLVSNLQILPNPNDGKFRINSEFKIDDINLFNDLGQPIESSFDRISTKEILVSTNFKGSLILSIKINGNLYHYKIFTNL